MQFCIRQKRLSGFVRYVGFAGVLVATVSCNGEFLPTSGPGRLTIINQAEIQQADQTKNKLQYALVDITPDVVDLMKVRRSNATFADLPQSPVTADVNIGLGDLIGITIFEAAAGGLFLSDPTAARQGNFVQLPTQQVAPDGTIFVPFAGNIPAAGRSPRAVQQDIQARLQHRALEPQVVVSIVEHRSNIVSVVGDVMTSVRYPLDPGGDRLLGAIARAQGPKFPDYETLVTVQRGGIAAHATLTDIGENPAENIQLRAGDTIFVSRRQRFYVALGAVGVAATLSQINRRIPFEDTALSLADAIGKAGGLAEDRATPKGVFLYRDEPIKNVQAMLKTDQTANLPAIVPTIYLLDMSKPDSMFLASHVPMQTEDVIFVSNAPSTDLSKFIAILSPIALDASYIRTGVIP